MSLKFLRLNCVFLFGATALIVILFSFSENRMKPEVLPLLMLAWSVILYVAPLWLLLPAEEWRYLYWPVAASLISIVILCANSELIRTILKLIVNYWETRLRYSVNSTSENIRQ